MIDGIEIVSVNSLNEALIYFESGNYPKFTKKNNKTRMISPHMLLESIVGQNRAKRSLIIAAAG